MYVSTVDSGRTNDQEVRWKAVGGPISSLHGPDLSTDMLLVCVVVTFHVSHTSLTLSLGFGTPLCPASNGVPEWIEFCLVVVEYRMYT